MVAVAQVADPDGIARSQHYAAVAGRSTPQLSVARQGLIDKGLVEAAGHGRVRFTMPGFGEFVLDRVNLPALWPQIAATGTPPISGAISAPARPEPPHLPGSPSSPPAR